jgi:neutral/alkaline ceramidase-like enzyme
MTLTAGFAEADITPPIGSIKSGWLVPVVSKGVLDPVKARAMVLDCDDRQVAIVSLDLLSIRWTTTQEIRRRVAREHGLSPDAILVAATHNHSGPAVANLLTVFRDEGYIETLVEKVSDAIGRAIGAMVPAELGWGSCFEFGVCYNRRVVMRDGTARTHGTFNDPDALHLEGPVDPEVAVLAVRSAAGEPLGALVNFACHATQPGPTPEFTAGYPGALADRMKANAWPVTVFLNGACGNLHCADPTRGGAELDANGAGHRLADDALGVIEKLTYTDQAVITSARTSIDLPYRELTEDQIRGTAPGAQRFVDPDAYDVAMPRLLERIQERRTQPAEVQAMRIGDHAIAAIPAEYFVEYGLKIKLGAHPLHGLVASCANGMVGYVPTADALPRGGYETTFTHSSRLAPEAGDLLADEAVRLIRSLDGTRA